MGASHEPGLQRVQKMPLRARDFRASIFVFKRNRLSVTIACQFARCCCTHFEVALPSSHKRALLISGSSTQTKCTGSKRLGMVPVFLPLASANLHWPCRAGLVPMMETEQRVTS